METLKKIEKQLSEIHKLMEEMDKEFEELPLDSGDFNALEDAFLNLQKARRAFGRELRNSSLLANK